MFSLILKRDNCMMNTDNKESKMVVHQEDLGDSVIFSVSSVEEAKNQLVQEKPNQSSSKFKLHLTMFILDAWKKSKSKDKETAKNAMEKEVKMFKNVPNVKEEVLYKSLFNSAQVCTHKAHKDVLIVRVRVKQWNKLIDVKFVKDKKSRESKKPCKSQSSKVFQTITTTFLPAKATKHLELSLVIYMQELEFKITKPSKEEVQILLLLKRSVFWKLWLALPCKLNILMERSIQLLLLQEKFCQMVK